MFGTVGREIGDGIGRASGIWTWQVFGTVSREIGESLRFCGRRGYLCSGENCGWSFVSILSRR